MSSRSGLQQALGTAAVFAAVLLALAVAIVHSGPHQDQFAAGPPCADQITQHAPDLTDAGSARAKVLDAPPVDAPACSQPPSEVFADQRSGGAAASPGPLRRSGTVVTPAERRLQVSRAAPPGSVGLTLATASVVRA